MNKAIATTLFILSLTLSPLFGVYDKKEVPEEQSTDIQKRFTYLRFDYGLPMLFSLNCGKRAQQNHHGFDISVGTYLPLPWMYGMRTNINYNFFPKPNAKSQYYFGIGLHSIRNCDR